MTVPPEQQAVARFLTDLAGGQAKETAISAVFIGADTVWKLKKAVHPSFLDFSTVKARAHFLRRELAINQPAAPGLYRDVIGITRRADGRLELSDDDPIDFVLRMARVPETDFLESIVSSNGLTPALLDALGDTVAAYHAGLPPHDDRDGPAIMLGLTQGNAASALTAGLPRADVEAWQQQMLAAIEAHRPILARRAACDAVRRCHGDLHLGNICLWQGTPVLFDALEFDEDMATIDVGYDLAFLLMDLDRRVGRAAANRVMNRYIARTGDAGATAALPVFLSQRAIVRAHVLAAAGRDGAAYLAAAQAYLAPARRVVLAIGGLQGTGKSTLARAVAPDLGAAPGALILRSDEIRKRLHHQPPEVCLPEEAYSAEANAAANAMLTQQTGQAEGHSVVADATFLDKNVRRDFAAAASRSGARFLGVWLHAPFAVLEPRIAARTDDASDATIAVLRQSAGDDPGAGDWLAVEATDGERALACIRNALTQEPS